MKPELKVSVIIPTFNGAHKLPFVLSSLEKQSVRSFEIIIAVDGSTDNTLSVLKEWEGKFSSLRIAMQSNKGRASARNLGAQNALNELLVFFDDDMIIEPTSLAKHINHHLSVKNSILVGGQLDDLSIIKTDIQRYKGYLSRKWARNSSTSLQPLKKEEVYITAANFSITQNTFKQLEGFDERLTDLEDNDLARRAYLNNITIYVDHTIIGWHNDFITLESYIKRNIEYRKALNTMLKLNPHYLEIWDFSTNIKYRNFKKLFYYPFSFHFWIKLVDKTNILKIIPKRFRYFIYDAIITSHYLYFPDSLNRISK